jgi:pyruvate/2-oxoglutarate dehydrogenase complex dihydrolipoamide dehydrogenase (E3) component
LGPAYLDTDPAVAAVGWMEREAAEAGLEVEVESDVVEMVTAHDKTIAEPSKPASLTSLRPFSFDPLL